MRILVVSSQWPSPQQPDVATFVSRGVDLLREDGLEVETFTFHGGRNVRRYLRARREMADRIEERAIDLVHAHFGQSALVVPASVRSVVSFYDVDLVPTLGDATSVGSSALAAFGRRAARRADAVIVASQQLGRSLPAGVQFEVIPPGVDLETFRERSRDESRAELGLPSAGRLILFCRSALTRDSFFLAFEAVKELRRRMDVDLVALPHVAPEEIARYIGASDVVVVGGRQAADVLTVKRVLACNRRVVAVETEDTQALLADVEGCATWTTSSAHSLAGVLERVLAVEPSRQLPSIVADEDEARMVERISFVYRRVMASS